jgi:protein-S-isoprenylcysteine O-methyltransferase Ste14
MVLGGIALHARAHHRLKAVVAFLALGRPRIYLRDGIFRLRHPAYIGNLLSIAGAGCAALDWGGLALAFAAWPFYANRILHEELIRDASESAQGRRQAA